MKFFRLTSSGRVCTIKILQICRAEISYKNNGVTNMQNILIVVDMQNDFIDGTFGTKEAVAIVPEKYSSREIPMRHIIWKHRRGKIFRFLIVSGGQMAGRFGKNWMF